jgi:hypothetical protein
VLLIAPVVEVEDYDVRLAAIDAGVGSQVFENTAPDLISLSIVVALLAPEESAAVCLLGLCDRPAMTVAAVMLKSVFLPPVPVEFIRRLEAPAPGTQLHDLAQSFLLRGGVRVVKEQSEL